jgi:soluble lytic murein transglycosylase-like protein
MPDAWWPTRVTTDTPMATRLLVALLSLLLCVAAHAQVRQAAEPELRELLQHTVAQADSFQDRFDAEVWLLDMSTRMRRYIPDAEERLSLLRLVHREASKAGLRPDLVIALIHAESHFDRFAISSVGAQGMMQVMPFWKAELGRPQDNLTDNATNLRYGCTILSFYLRKENGDLNRALARYNGSLGKHSYSAKVVGFWHDFWYVKP